LVIKRSIEAIWVNSFGINRLGMRTV
jgi:hypothetical protein